MKSFIFDVDGTLLDTEWIFYESLTDALQIHQLRPERSRHRLWRGQVEQKSIPASGDFPELPHGAAAAAVITE